MTHIGSRLVLKWSATPQTGPSGPQFWRFLSIYPYNICRKTAKFHTVTHMGREFVFRWSATPKPEEDGVPAVPNLGIPFYLCVHRLSQKNTKFDVVRALRGMGLFARVSHAPTSRGWTPVLSNFGGSFYVHHLSHNYQISRGNISERGQPRLPSQEFQRSPI